MSEEILKEVKTRSKVKTEKEYDNEAMSVKEILAAQPKRRVKLGMDPEEKEKYDNMIKQFEAGKIQESPTPPYIPVGINGYTYNVAKGESIDIPEAIFEILEHAGLV